MSHQIEQKQIAKNTLFLYIRMFLVMIVSLYTSRVVLDKLGVEDYGIYSIAGSVVVSLTFVKNSLRSATQRFLSYAKGENRGTCSSVFSMSLNIHLLILIVSFILLETIGLWFFNDVIQVPVDRRAAASFVYQMSILSFCVTIGLVPFSALIVSNEKMSVYAIVSIVEVVLKLLVALSLSLSNNIDKLQLYSVLLLLVTIITDGCIMLFCWIKLKDDCKYKFQINWSEYKKFFSFSTWNLIGGLSGVANTECPNYFINYYLGVSVNAAMGVAKHVSNIVYGFSANFQSAFSPQIVKAYASKEYDYLFSLIFRTSKISFVLMYVITIPVLICSNEILNLWLKVVPEYTSIFCVCIMISQLVAAVSSPFWMAAHAIGNIRKYQLVLMWFNISVLPVSFIVLSFHFEPYYILIYQIIASFGIFIYRINYLSKKIKFPILKFYKDVIIRLFIYIPLLTIPVILIISSYFDEIIRILVVSFLSLLVALPVTFFVGFEIEERTAILNYIYSKIHHH